MMAAAPISISQLPDNLLQKVFTYLPFKDRGQLRLVSQKWNATSRPWDDITILKLKSVKSEMVDPILDLCPNAREIRAEDQTIILKASEPIPITPNLHTMQLCNVSFALNSTIQHAGNALFNFRVLLGEFFQRFPRLTTVSWRDVLAVGLSRAYDVALPSETAPSVKQIVQIDTCGFENDGVAYLQLQPSGMHNLEHFFWHSHTAQFPVSGLFSQLHELGVVDSDVQSFGQLLTGENFPNLQVIIFSSRIGVSPEAIAALILSSVALRILVIAGSHAASAVPMKMLQAMDPATALAIFSRAVIPAANFFFTNGSGYLFTN